MPLPHPQVRGFLALAGRLHDAQLPHHGHRVVAFPALHELAVGDTYDLHSRQCHPVVGWSDARKLPFVGAGARPAGNYLIPFSYLILDLEVQIREG